jgi:hypothetical protein
VHENNLRSVALHIVAKRAAISPRFITAAWRLFSMNANEDDDDDGDDDDDEVPE